MNHAVRSAANEVYRKEEKDDTIIRIIEPFDVLDFHN